MRAAVFEKFQGPITIQNVTDPAPGNHGVVVKVNATGLCRSDWHGWMGHDSDIILPHIPGHELAGTINAIGKDVLSFKVGDRVTVPFVCGCGTCGQCKSGNHQVCDHQSQPGFTHWGSFAEFVALDYDGHELPKRNFRVKETFKQGWKVSHGIYSPTNVVADLFQHVIIGEIAKRLLTLNK